MHFVSCAESGCVAGGGQVRPQGLEPLITDHVGRVLAARPASPLPVGVPRICQAGPPPLNRFVALRVQLHFDLVPMVGVFHHSREKGISGRPRNARHAHCRRAHDHAHQAHRCPVHTLIVPSEDAVTPSGFEWEVGWNPIVVDEASWEPTTYRGISLWGHTPEGQTIIEKLTQFKTGAASLLRDEDVVPALAGAGIPDN
jgi:hypothetical protein